MQSIIRLCEIYIRANLRLPYHLSRSPTYKVAQMSETKSVEWFTKGAPNAGTEFKYKDNSHDL